MRVISGTVPRVGDSEQFVGDSGGAFQPVQYRSGGADAEARRANQRPEDGLRPKPEDR